MKKSRASRAKVRSCQDPCEETPEGSTGRGRMSARLSKQTLGDKAYLSTSSNLTATEEHQLEVIDIEKNCTDVLVDGQTSSNSNISEPKKTARRGLTKSKTNVEFTQPSQVHNASVYSQCVPETFKHLMENANLLKKCDSENNLEGSSNNANQSSTNSEAHQSMLKNDEKAESSLIESELTEFDGDDPKPTDSSLLVRSPTPPRNIRVPKKKRKVNKRINGALKTLNSLKDKLDHTTPVKRKRRSKDDDIIFIHEEKPEISVKVRYLSTVHRIKMSTTETLHSLISKLSSTIGEDENILALYLRDECLKLSETPMSLNLSVADIIECHCLKPEEGDVNMSDAIQLVIQCHSNKTKTVITASKRGPLRDVMNKYATMKNLDPATLVFSFDGEDIDPTDTPFKLEMEDHDCIDVSG